jgi:hypothetical protein
MGKPGTSSKTSSSRPDFDEAFHIENGSSGRGYSKQTRTGSAIGLRAINNSDSNGGEYTPHQRSSYDENVLLAPYTYPQRESPEGGAVNSQDSSPTTANFRHEV